MITIGKKAPSFTAEAMFKGKIQSVSLDQFDGYKVLIFYPLNFTFVCPTELHAFEEQREAFWERNTQLIGISVDSVHSHRMWLDTPKAQAGIAGVGYPLVSDITKNIARDYGVLDEEAGVALRGLFILDSQNNVQVAMVNNLPLGRNVDEVLRLVDALQMHEKHGAVCPANWTAGKATMQETPESVKEYFANN